MKTQLCPYCKTPLPYKSWRKNGKTWLIVYGKCINKKCRINKEKLEYSGFNFESWQHPDQSTLR